MKPSTWDIQCHETIQQAIAQWNRHWLLRSLVLIVVWSLSIAMIWTLLRRGSWQDLSAPLALTLPLTALCIIMLRWRKRVNPTKCAHLQKFAQHLDHHLPSLQYSSFLLISTPHSALQTLQRERIANGLQTEDLRQTFPALWTSRDLKRWAPAAAAMALALLIGSRIGIDQSRSLDSEQPGSQSAAITQLNLQIAPPAYTDLPASAQQDWEAAVPEGSQVTWQITTRGTVDAVHIVFNQKETISLARDKNRFVAKQIVDETRFYSVRLLKNDKVINESPFYKLAAIADQTPKLTIEQPNESVVTGDPTWRDLPLAIRVADDYGLARAELRLTLARGSGENVRFRDKAFPLPLTDHDTREQRIDHHLTLSEWDIEPGDELYFFVYAWDNRQPEANRGRSTTVIVRFPAEDETPGPALEGLAIDLLPEYFRSQRQIIIDTEKLIAERNSVSDTTFKVRANNLGIDQKMLRLRYGKFLGEEFEATIGPGDPSAAAAATDHDHDDDHGDDHGHAAAEADYAGLDDHDEDGDMWRGDWAADEGYETEVRLADNEVIADAIHVHDVEGAETFFSDPVKVQLKQVLGQMWESELRLRTFYPAESLPYQYRALKWLKELQQASRIYVKRVGFEPPPIDESAVRYSGELDDIQTQSEQKAPPETPWQQALQNALTALAQPTSEDLPRALRAVETSLADSQRALDHLNLLNRCREAISQWSAQGLLDETIREDLRALLWAALPARQRLWSPTTRPATQAADAYRQTLQGTQP